MKKAVFIFSLFMLLKPVLPVLEYVVFYDYITKELCVNRGNPASGCNGKCHLKKELANASHSESDPTKHFSVESQILFCESSIITDFTFCFSIQIKRSIFGYNDLYVFDKEQLIFQPPVLI